MMPVTPTPLVVRPVVGVRSAIVPVTVSVMRATNTEFKSGALKMETLGPGRVRDGENGRADEAERDQSFCYDSHGLSSDFLPLVRVAASVQRRCLDNSRRNSRFQALAAGTSRTSRLDAVAGAQRWEQYGARDFTTESAAPWGWNDDGHSHALTALLHRL